MNWRLYVHQSRRWLVLAVLPGLLLGSIIYWYTNRAVRHYEATATLYVQQAQYSPNGASPITDITGSTQLVPTYTALINQPEVYLAVDQLMARKWPGYHIGSVSASQPTDTQLVEIAVTDTIPARAADAANAVGKAFVARIKTLESSRFASSEQSQVAALAATQKNISDTLDRIAKNSGNPATVAALRVSLATYQSTQQQQYAALQQFRVARDSQLNGVSLASTAKVPTAPTGLHPLRTALLWAFVVIALSSGAIFLYDYFDDTMRDPDEVEDIAGAPILGTVEAFSTRGPGTQLVTASDPRSHMAEAYRLIRTNILFTNIDRPPHTLVITSASPKEGKSTTSSNLARVFADGGYEVTLIDADLRRPSLHRIFQVEPREGLTNMLLMGGSLNGLGMQRTDHPNLDLIVAGPLPPNPADLLSSQRMRHILANATASSRLTIIDAPPILPVTDATILATMVDGVILVVDPTRTKRRDLRRSRESVEGVGGKIIGVVINNVSRKGAGYNYYYHQYGYQHTYTYGAMPERPKVQGTSAKAPVTTQSQKD